jgi:PKD repeat protein
MSNFRGIRGLLLALTGCMMLIATMAASAWAAPGVYGELAHFGKQGTGLGEFDLEGTTDAFGVDPTTESVYVGDGPTSKKEYRIQKFEDVGGKWEAVASVSFKPPSDTEGLEGIAVDPTEGRIYALAVQPRPEETVDAEVPAAGTLYAFSTTASGGKLEPAENEGKPLPEGVLVAAGTLKPGKAAEKDLLEPSGIAVDPTTHDLIILGKADPEEKEEPVAAIERVHANGTIGPRWLDKTDFFSTEQATSPTVSPTGKVYVSGGALEFGGAAGESLEQLDEIPSNFASTAAPISLTDFNPGPNELVTFPGLPEPIYGGGLSTAPDGTIYAYAGIKQQTGDVYSTLHPGVLAFTSAGAETGWTGGQNQTEKSGHVPCGISFEGHPLVAAGGGEHVFVFAANPAEPEVVEFGPGGSGCLEASASALSASVKGAPVSGPVAAGTKVTLASTVTQANALSVKWEFKGGSEAEPSEEVTTDEYQTTSLEHAFKNEGEVTVKETIHTDDLATPTITVEKTLKVNASPPTAQFSSLAEANVGEAVTFNASNSSDPNGSPITEYVWNFGDGDKVTTEKATITHTYEQAGEYTVTLEVLDKLKKTSAPVAHTIKANKPAPPPKKEEVVAPPPSTEKTQPPPPPPPVPDAELAGTALAVSSSGAVGVKVSCPAAESSCAGTVTLRTLGAVSARAAGHKKKRKAAILTLATGSFTVSGGKVQTVTLHLSAKARALLAGGHVLRAQATIVAHDPSGASHTTQTTVTLRLAKTKRRR